MSFFRIQPGTQECPEKVQPIQHQRPVTMQVREHLSPTIDKEHLSQMVVNFLAGRPKDHVGGWKSLTGDPVILDAIKHYHIEFGEDLPIQICGPR